MAPTPITERTPELIAALDGLPARVRVHELARRAGLNSKQAIAALSEAGVTVGSASSSVDREVAESVLRTLLGAPEAAGRAQPQARTAKPPAPEKKRAASTAARKRGGDDGDTAASGPQKAPASRKKRTAAAASPAGDEPVTDALFTEAPTTHAPATDMSVIEAPAADAPAAPSTAKARSRRTRTRADADTAPSTGVAAGSEVSDGSRPDTETGTGTDTGTQADAQTGADGDLAANEHAGDSSGRRRRRGGRGRRGSGRGEHHSGTEAAADREPEAKTPDGATTEKTGAARARDRRSKAAPQAAAGAETAGAPEPPGEPESAGAAASADRQKRPARSESTESVAADSETPAAADSGDSADSAGQADSGDTAAGDTAPDSAESSESGDSAESASSRRRRRRRRRSGSGENGADDSADSAGHGRSAGTDVPETVQGVQGSTRLAAKRQRRRDSRESRRRPQVLSEAEFLARRESVDRVMAVRQRGDLAQVALLEDGVLVEHFVSRRGSASMIGNVYLGRVQNVLPSMEAAFVDIGKGRNAVLYAGEVNWDIAGLEGKERRIETALSSGDTVLVQVSKDPIGHKGARLTTQISLPGRFLVYVPGGGATGISRKLPDTERKRLRSVLDRIVSGDAGVIIRTAAEGVGEDELARDVERLKAQWEQITAAAEQVSSAPTELYAEPDTLIKVIRDLFNSDINRLLVDGDDAWASVSKYVVGVAPELADRVSRYVGDNDVFAAFRIDEQISKALARKVHLPSGGSLVIDRTEAMTVIDVNTGKFTGSGGNLEETVTRNNLEAAEEIVRQLRLRDIGGIIVVDFIDMVLQSNRDLVLRRLTECLGRDRTRHQVAEVTSLGLVQMTRKRMGLGLVEAFSEPCTHCGGRGIVLHDIPADTGPTESDAGDGDDRARRKGRKRGRQHDDGAKFEPLIVERITADARPDPRGPKPPVLFRPGSGDAADDTKAAPGGNIAPADAAGTRAEAVSDDAPGPEAEALSHDTVSAQAHAPSQAPVGAEAAARPGGDTGEPGNGPAVTDGTNSAAVTDGSNNTVIVAAPAKQRRRRAASRAAGPVTQAVPASVAD